MKKNGERGFVRIFTVGPLTSLRGMSLINLLLHLLVYFPFAETIVGSATTVIVGSTVTSDLYEEKQS